MSLKAEQQKNTAGLTGAVRGRGFSLAEVLAALIISSMILIAVLAVYRRTECSAMAATSRFENSQMPAEVVQRIAEDLDSIISSALGTRIIIHDNSNKFEHGYQNAKLEIIRNVMDSNGAPVEFERIIWQGGSDYDVPEEGLVLYRCFRGKAFEDRLLEEKRPAVEAEYPFIPVCKGMTFFKVQAFDGKNYLDAWTGNTLPYGVRVTVSFAEPVETSRGIYEVPEEGKYSRIIAIDRMRKIKFEIPQKDYGLETGEDVNDTNVPDINDLKGLNEPNVSERNLPSRKDENVLEEIR